MFIKFSLLQANVEGKIFQEGEHGLWFNFSNVIFADLDLDV